MIPAAAVAAVRALPDFLRTPSSAVSSLKNKQKYKKIKNLLKSLKSPDFSKKVSLDFHFFIRILAFWNFFNQSECLKWDYSNFTRVIIICKGSDKVNLFNNLVYSFFQIVYNGI